MEDQEGTKPVERGHAGSPRAKSGGRGIRALKFGCLGLLLTMCGGLGVLGWGLQSGPLTLQLLGNNVLRLGSDDFVLSNYSFQDGTTYYIDLNGNNVRNILQLHYIEDSHSLELVLHYADRSEQGEHHLAEISLP